MTWESGYYLRKWLSKARRPHLFCRSPKFQKALIQHDAIYLD